MKITQQRCCFWTLAALFERVSKILMRVWRRDFNISHSWTSVCGSDVCERRSRVKFEANISSKHLGTKSLLSDLSNGEKKMTAKMLLGPAEDFRDHITS